MNIIKYKKVGLSKYKIITDKNQFMLFDEIILKYNLLNKNEIDLNLLDEILKENSFYEMYDYSVNLINKKLRTEKEIRDILIKKEVNDHYIDRIVSKLKKENLLNDKIYINAFINDKVNLSSDGKYKIKSELLYKGFDEISIDEELNKINDNIFKDKLIKLIKKRKVTSSINSFVNKMMYEFSLKGYDSELIRKVLESVNFNEVNNLESDYKKALSKYKDKFSGKMLNQKIINNLITKGYTFESINKLIKGE